MAKDNSELPQLPKHGALVLPRVEVKSYNVEIEDTTGFVGDKASKSAFWELLDKWRKPLKELGEDPLGDTPSEKISKKKLAELLIEGEPKAAGVVQSAVEEFAHELTTVIRRFLRLKEWRDTEYLVVGGGFRNSRIGELAIGRSAVLLKAEGIAIDLELIRHHPDEAGLLGAAQLLPAWMLKGYEAILAVDVGGTNIRAGIVELNLQKSRNLTKARILKSSLWRHGDENVNREQVVKSLVDMLDELIRYGARKKTFLAPFIGIGCPGVINEDGSIERGAHNLPGNWESSRFNLPKAICEQIPKIGDHETMVVMHNDAVLQGLSERPFMEDQEHWGVLTIGTGLGNASFVNREP
jgi:predicted NBD/HSP70 family sugar kinase